jgi:hypothetical protein
MKNISSLKLVGIGRCKNIADCLDGQSQRGAEGSEGFCVTKGDWCVAKTSTDTVPIREAENRA